MRSSSVKAVAFAALLLIGAGCHRASSNPSGKPPALELKDLSGHAVSLARLRGHPVLLDFWATWCGPCRISSPMVEEFFARHQKEGLVVIGVNMDEDPSDVLAFTKHFGMTYPVVLAGSTSVPTDFQIDGLPTFILINPEGQIVQRTEGFDPELIDTWESLLKSMKPKTH
jgi:cytochrome c biogenesis protein CcmG, thiol:disulfide interchange protein DsbE